MFKNNFSYKFIVVILYCLFQSVNAEYKVRAYDHVHDFTAISDICSQSWRELGEPNQYCSHSFIKLFDRWQKHHPTSMICKVIEDDSTQRVIGFALVGMTLPLKKNIVMGELTYIALDEKYQGQGLGARLFSEMISSCKAAGLKGLISNVKSANHNALRWHDALGFVKVLPSATISKYEEELRIRTEAYGYVMLRLFFDAQQQKYYETHAKSHSLKSLSYKEIQDNVDHDSFINQGQQMFIHSMMSNPIFAKYALTDRETVVIMHFILQNPTTNAIGIVDFSSRLLQRTFSLSEAQQFLNFVYARLGEFDVSQIELTNDGLSELPIS